MSAALAFDVYGTLIDTHGVVVRLREFVGDKAQDFSRVWREKQLEYSFRRGLMRRYETFGVCTSQALEYTNASLGTELTTDQKAALMAEYRSLPAISESSASGEIADIYADIRQTLNVTAINYVWRHIATIDGGLRWAWEAARPMFVSGRVAGECEHLLAQLSYPKLPALSATTLSLVGVNGDGRDTIGAILDTYNRGNLLNMVSLSALLAEPVTAPTGRRPRVDLPSTALPLPPIPEVTDLSATVSEQVLVLNSLGAKPGPNRVVASIYKHIALWPGYLSLSWAQLAAMHADGSLLHLIEVTQQKARLHAAYLAGDLGPRPAGPVADRVRGTVHEFTDTVIARMIPIGQMLRQSLIT